MKKLSVLTFLFSLVLIALLSSSCSKEDIPVTFDLTGSWKVTSYEDLTASTIITKTESNSWLQFNNGDINITFSSTDSFHGNINGIKVTNTFEGGYTIDGKGKIQISNYMQTEVNEPDWGDYFNAITEIESYEVKGNSLKIYYTGKTKCINFVKIDN